jgi:predicted MPP superfamily phosphohydrolase
LILLTGDFLSTSYNRDPQAVSDLRTLLAQFHAPAGLFAIWGTPEVDIPHVLRPSFVDLGIDVLEDRATELDIRGTRIWLMGVTCTRNLDEADVGLAQLLVDAPPDALTVLLFHTPDLFPRASARGVDLILSGHTHGGQWRVPGFGAILTSSRYWKRFEAGLYHEGDSHMYVSRGLGMEGFGAPRARFFCPPEIVSIRLVGSGR